MGNETIEILKIIIARREESLSIRKISLLRKINYKTAYMSLHSLQKDGLARLENTGNTTLCSFTNKFDEKTFIAEYERKKDILKNKDILVLHERLNELEFPFIALLFGSQAKGTAQKHSDIDILTIGEHSIEIKKTIALLPDKVHLTSVNYKEFITMAKSREYTVVSEAIKHNIILVGIEEYYRLLKNAGF